jgi:hypothetical protein
MYYYSYPLTANPQNGVDVVANSHNSPLHMLLELGVTGLITFATVADRGFYNRGGFPTPSRP